MTQSDVSDGHCWVDYQSQIDTGPPFCSVRPKIQLCLLVYLVHYVLQLI